mmetsp:Transcript_13523/g.24490  ORF Transcript_13523/g.24490 Transcript_13523/m.24490 type:complete len:176 (-) Transcript_13523:2252-2779(-)
MRLPPDQMCTGANPICVFNAKQVTNPIMYNLFRSVMMSTPAPNASEAMGPENGDGPSNGDDGATEGKATMDQPSTAHDLALERREALLTIREERSSESSMGSFSVANSTLGEAPKNLLDSLAYVAPGEEDVIYGDHNRNDYYTSGEDENPDQTEEWSSLDDVSGDDISGQWRSKA